MIIDDLTFDLIEERGDAYKEEEIINRWSQVLNQYDYILGDWGYGKLRLKGFYDDNYKKATVFNKFSAIYDYIHEYCNFGCPYFILKRKDEEEIFNPDEQFD